MLKFVFLQFKRVLKILPRVLIICLLLFLGMFVVFQGLSAGFDSDDQQTKMQIAVCGEIDHPFLELGISAIQAFDSSKYTVDILLMSEDEAFQSLQAGKISAYVSIPEGFMESAIAGDLIPLKYVGTATSVGVSSIFKDEITRAVSHIVEACQNGMLAAHVVAQEQGRTDLISTYMDDISMSYLEYVLIRSEVYALEEVEVTDKLGFDGYLISGISVVFLLLLLLPFGILYIRNDLSIDRLMRSKKHNQISLVLGEFLSFFLGLIAVLCLMVLILSLAGPILGTQNLFSEISAGSLFSLIPAVFCLCAMSYLLFNLSDGIVGGMLLQFVVDIAICFVSGCMYPISFFPVLIQKLSNLFPTTYARQAIAGVLTGETDIQCLTILSVFGFVFLGVTCVVRYHRVHRIRG